MSKSEDISLVGRIYQNNSLRFGIFPEKRTHFEGAPYLESLKCETLASRWTEQGILACQHKDVRFLYDAALGLFKLSIKKKESISGMLQTGQFSSALFFIELQEEEKIYGFGAASGKADRNDQKFQLLNRDTFLYSVPQASYSSFPFFLFRRGEKYHGILWNSTLPVQVRTLSTPQENFKRGVYIKPLTYSGSIAQDFFVFTGSLREVLNQFFEITGKSFLPPLWSLGYHQSRWSYRTADEVLGIASKFRKLAVPCDAIHLDIHYMDRYRVFTWNPKRFAKPKILHRKLNSMGFQSVAIVDPCVAVDEQFSIYTQGKAEGHFCKNSRGELYTGRVWPGKSVFPDFTRKATRSWWSTLHRDLFTAGVSGIWNDMNDPTLKLKQNYKPLEEDIHHSTGSHQEVRNLYANLEAKASYEAFAKDPRGLRPWILTRSAFCGIQKYSVLWTGDNSSSWKSLRESLYMALNLSLSGVAHCGFDVGGFASGMSKKLPVILRIIKIRKKPKLLGRWLELGALMPFFRMHTSLLSHSQEPWSFGKKCLAVCQKHIKRRYQLLPYLYTLAWEMHKKGSLWLRPLGYEFPELGTEIESKQFLVGPALLAAPVLYPRTKTREVYLPPGIWYEYESGTVYEGNTRHHFKTPLGYYPLFVRGGSILPLCRPLHNAKSSVESSLFLELYPAQEMYGVFYQDDGQSQDYIQGNYNLLECKGYMKSTRALVMQIRFLHKEYISPFQEIEVRLPKRYRYLQDGDQRTEAYYHNLKEEDRNFVVSCFKIPYASGRYIFRSE